MVLFVAWPIAVGLLVLILLGLVLQALANRNRFKK